MRQALGWLDQIVLSDVERPLPEEKDLRTFVAASNEWALHTDTILGQRVRQYL